MTTKPQLSDTERLAKYRKFVNGLESYTENFDDMCDCGSTEDDDMNSVHDDDCMTMNFRKDVQRLEE